MILNHCAYGVYSPTMAARAAPPVLKCPDYRIRECSRLAADVHHCFIPVVDIVCKGLSLLELKGPCLSKTVFRCGGKSHKETRYALKDKTKGPYPLGLFAVGRL